MSNFGGDSLPSTKKLTIAVKNTEKELSKFCSPVQIYSICLTRSKYPIPRIVGAHYGICVTEISLNVSSDSHSCCSSFLKEVSNN